MTCAITACERPAASRGWCTLHYHRWWRNGDPTLAIKSGGHVGPCSVENCTSDARVLGMCKKHWQRAHKHGNPLTVLRNRDHDGTCTVEGCDRPYAGAGVCKLHLDRKYAHGSATLADEMADAQSGLCAICQRPPRGRGHESRLHLDHDHETGRVRAMLCGPCNKAIGLLNDNAELVRAALAYLESHERTVA